MQIVIQSPNLTCFISIVSKSILLKIGQSKIQDGGHFPRWPRTNKLNSSYSWTYVCLVTVYVDLTPRLNAVCDTHPYPRVQFTRDIKWNKDIHKITATENRILAFVRRNLYTCPLNNLPTQLFFVNPWIFIISMGPPHQDTRVGPVLLVSREWTREWRVCAVPIKFIVGVRHALISPQSYAIRVHV